MMDRSLSPFCKEQWIVVEWSGGELLLLRLPFYEGIKQSNKQTITFSTTDNQTNKTKQIRN
jgi:sulfatase maturation enzyme AslB (radical SAM superfamily)